MSAPATPRTQSPPSGAEELRALSSLAFAELSAFPGAIRDMHLGIAGRAFRASGSAAAPVRIAHDAISYRAYAGVAAAFRGAGRAADALLTRADLSAIEAPSDSRAGSALLGALSGLSGDRLERSGSVLHQPPTIRVDARAVPIRRGELAAAFPDATEDLVVFLHGLMGTEAWWRIGAQRESPNDRRQVSTYGERLRDELGWTPLFVRYNSGLHVSENGRALSTLLDELVREWPVPVRRVALVGHSMGGLVARSAAHYGSVDGAPWIPHVRAVVSLGTPHLGAPLEEAAHRAAAALSSLPETRMLGSFLRRRSAGIRDLRQGSLVDEDWRGRDPDALRAAAVQEVPLLAGATHCFVSATVTRDPGHPLARLLGDTLVLVPSATGQGRTRRIPFEPEHGHHVAPAHHLTLLNHPDVYARLRDWLAAAH